MPTVRIRRLAFAGGFAVLVAEQHALWSEAHLDVLTKALTRRAFMSDLARADRDLSAQWAPCSLIMFDLDHFKAVNDTHGHAAGDAVLRAVAHVVQSELRRCDILGRLGGEEFGVLVTADHLTALEIAERLRAVSRHRGARLPACRVHRQPWRGHDRDRPTPATR